MKYGIFKKDLMKFGDKDLVFFIYYEQKPVAVCVVLPDLNPCSSGSTADRSAGLA